MRLITHRTFVGVILATLLAAQSKLQAEEFQYDAYARRPQSTFALPAVRGPWLVQEDLVGTIYYVRGRFEQSLAEIGREFNIGYDLIVKSNPGVHRWLPGKDTPIRIPALHILPRDAAGQVIRSGIVINLAEMRLYYFPEQPAPKVNKLSKGRGKVATKAQNSERRPFKQQLVYTYPVSIGRMDWRTPLGESKIVKKDRNPPWYPPESIRKEYAAEGEILPAFYPGGSPENPLGGYALRLSLPMYLIHGVDERKALGIGMRVTHGCMRMYPEDISHLFNLVNVGTKVHLLNQPVKSGWRDGFLYLEVHTPLDEAEQAHSVALEDLIREVEKNGVDRREVSLDLLKRILKAGSGVPQPVYFRSKVAESLGSDLAERSEPYSDSEIQKRADPALYY